MGLKILSYGASDVGCVRKSNEDRWEASPEIGLYLLADGMGGHLAGNVAAELTIETLSQYVHQNPASTVKQAEALLSQGIVATNEIVHARGCSESCCAGMGSTLCCLYQSGGEMVYAHVGDSRIYLHRDGRLKQLTEDHSLVEQLLGTGKIGLEEAERFKSGHVITRAIGPKPSVKPVVSHLTMRPGDCFLMCSDGLSDAISFAAIEAILNCGNSPVERLIKAARDAGGEDNITVVLVEVESD